MKPRTIVILAVIGAALLGVWHLSQRTKESSQRLASGPIFPELAADAVAGIRLTAAGKTVQLSRGNDGWVVDTEGGYRADSTQVNRMLDLIPKFDLKQLRSRNPEMQRTFEVDDSSGTELLFTGSGERTLAHFRMGKNGPDYRSQYIRPVDSPSVYLIPSYMKSVFDAQRPTWRDRTIFAFDQQKVSRVAIMPAEGADLVVVKDDAGNYTLTAPDSAAVQTNLIEATIRTMATLRCDAFPDSLPGSLEAAGLEPPRERIEVYMSDGATLALNVGHAADDVRHYVKKDGDDTLFLLTTGRVKNLIRKVEDLREEPPAPATEGDGE